MLRRLRVRFLAMVSYFGEEAGFRSPMTAADSVSLAGKPVWCWECHA